MWGFVLTGTFRWTGSCVLETAEKIPKVRAIYAFVRGDEVLYVGAATDLRRRLGAYRRRQQHGSRRRRPVHGLLTEALGKSAVQVFTRTFDEEHGTFDGLPVDLLIGVEAGLIATTNPIWNRRGVRRLAVELPVVRPDE